MGSLPKSFNDLINTSNKPVLVDFYADWCAPCKMVSPIIQNLAKEYSGKIITVKINIDNEFVKANIKTKKLNNAVKIANSILEVCKVFNKLPIQMDSL